MARWLTSSAVLLTMLAAFAPEYLAKWHEVPYKAVRYWQAICDGLAIASLSLALGIRLSKWAALPFILCAVSFGVLKFACTLSLALDTRFGVLPMPRTADVCDGTDNWRLWILGIAIVMLSATVYYQWAKHDRH